MPGNYLVFVHFDPKMYGNYDVVYNEPDIDHAKIVFARDMGPQKNKDLLRYYARRSV